MPTKEISQDEINGLAWKACDTFRGVVDPAEYKNYILVFLFIKYISDVWKDKQEQLKERYAGDETRIQRALQRERFIVPNTSTYDYLYENRNADNIGELINEALEAIEDANKGKLDGVFRNIDFNSEGNLGQTKDRNRRLKHLINDFSDPRMDFQPSHVGNQDIIGNTYEYLISRFASDAGKKGGEFYTPAEVSELLARLLAPKPGMRIYDPTCGSGSLLIKVAEQIDSANYSLYGQESNGSTWALCKMNMFLHEKDNARIEWGDTIGNPKLVEADALMKFDRVVANPPFSLDKWGAESAENDRFRRFWRGVPPKSKGDYAFISHMIESTVADGKVGVIVPHGVLFRGSSEGRIRKAMIEENLLEAVIGLPANLFFGTGIPASILIFNRDKGANRDVLFVDASKEFEQGKNQNTLSEGNMQKVLDQYTAFQTGKACAGEEGQVMEEKYSYRATFAELEENDFNLNIPRYVDTFEEEEPVDIVETMQEIEGLKQELKEVEVVMAGYLAELGFELKGEKG